MKTKRMTLHELRSLKPSVDNPITLICDDGIYTNIYQKVKVIGIDEHRQRAITLNIFGLKVLFTERDLSHYPSKGV